MSGATFGSRLRAARERRDMTMAYLASLTGLDQPNLSHYESGRRQPGADNIRALALALDISADFLLGLTDDTSRIKEDAAMTPALIDGVPGGAA